jgi:hypothetical protein
MGRIPEAHGAMQKIRPQRAQRRIITDGFQAALQFAAVQTGDPQLHSRQIFFVGILPTATGAGRAA